MRDFCCIIFIFVFLMNVQVGLSGVSARSNAEKDAEDVNKLSGLFC